MVHKDESSDPQSTSRLQKDSFSLSKAVYEGSVVASPNPYSNLDDLTVSWNGITCPNSGDWIGLFAPELYQVDSDSDVGYIDWQYVSDASPGTYMSGFGSMTFLKAMNLRNDIEFRYFSKNSTCQKNADSTWTLIATSDRVSPMDPNEPTQLHLALGNHYTQMTLSFVTNTATNATVYYGTSPSELTSKSTGTYSTYSADMMCAAPATYVYAPYFCNPGYLHTVTMTDLLPRQTYYYRHRLEVLLVPFTISPVRLLQGRMVW